MRTEHEESHSCYRRAGFEGFRRMANVIRKSLREISRRILASPSSHRILLSCSLEDKRLSSISAFPISLLVDSIGSTFFPCPSATRERFYDSRFYHLHWWDADFEELSTPLRRVALDIRAWSYRNFLPLVDARPWIRRVYIPRDFTTFITSLGIDRIDTVSPLPYLGSIVSPSSFVLSFLILRGITLSPFLGIYRLRVKSRRDSLNNESGHIGNARYHRRDSDRC